MKAGIELDALVAEKVMGWEEVRKNFGGLQAGGSTEYFVGLAPADKDGRRFHHPVPAYSTDIKHAWEVVEKLKECFPNPDSRRGASPLLYFRLRFDNYEKKWEACWADGDYHPEGEYFEGASASAPEAICLAAIKAVAK